MDSKDKSTPAAPALSDHPDRITLNNEVHARPYERLSAPLRATCISMLSGVASAESERGCIEDLSRRYGVNRPPAGANHFSADFGGFRLRWERHTEFSAYTILHSAPFAAPFEDPPLTRVPRGWLATLPGRVLTAVHIAIEPAQRAIRSVDELGDLFVPGSLVGSRVSGGSATAWTDFQIHADGFSRILIHDVSLGARQAGRLVQRLLEIETYRMMALLALPLARRYTPELFRVDTQVAEMSDSLTREMNMVDEKRLLEDLTRLSAEVERIAAATGFRFSAARAYYDIVRQRIVELREERHEKLQTFGEFMQRRLTPAMQTCESVNKRIEVLTARVARVSDLLQTRVNIAMESQSRDLLESMDRRAHLQVRLQETVEGLSVVVLSYYLVGLVNYGLKGLKSSGVDINVEILTAVSIIPVIALVLLGVRRLRRKITREAEKT